MTKIDLERSQLAIVMPLLVDTYGGPFKIDHQDKPDFRLHYQTGIIGVEVSELVEEEDKHASHLQLTDESLRGKVLNFTHLSTRPERRTKVEIRAEITNNFSAPQQTIGQMVSQWEGLLIGAIGKKRANLGKTGFDRFERNLLVFVIEAHFADVLIPLEDLASPITNVIYSAECEPDFDAVILAFRRRILSMLR